MKLAFLILAHKNPAQLMKLTDYLLENESVVLIHIDKKNVRDFQEFNTKYGGNKNVKIYSEYKVYWGSFNQIRATFYLLNQALNNFSFDYVSLISGQDLPLRTLKEFKYFLKLNEGKDFVNVFKVEANNSWSDHGGLDRMRLFWITDYSQNLKFLFSKVNLIIHKIQHAFKWYRKIAIELYGGANWFTLSFKTAKFVDEYIIKNNEFIKLFKNTRCADEIIMATILMNSVCKEKVEDNYLRYVDWQTGPESPRILRAIDFDRLSSLKNVFFARKFDEKIDNVIVEKIYSEILKS